MLDPRSLSLLGVLALASPALAQGDEPLDQRPFEVLAPFPSGEEWVTNSGVRVRVLPARGAPVERSVALTQSVAVVESEGGFSLRTTLTSIVREDRRRGLRTVTLWQDAEPGPYEDPGARTWTWELDRAWRIVRVEGPPALREPLLPQLAFGLSFPAHDLVNRRERAGSGPLEGFVGFWSCAGAPVRATLGSLRERPFLPGATLSTGPFEGWPAATVTYRGTDRDDHGHFAVTWAAAGGRSLQGSFAIDEAGRITRFAVEDTRTFGRGIFATRVVHEVVHHLLYVRRSAPRAADLSR